jgi:type I restriction enzyme S subunit
VTLYHVPLSDVASLQAGIGFPLELQGKQTGAYPFAKVGDISRCGRSGNTVLSAADHYVDDVDLATLRGKLIPAGSVLFAKIGEAIRQNHRVVSGCELLIDNNAMAAIPGPNTDSRFLYHFLKTVDFYRLAPATTVPAIRKSDLEKVPTPFPRLSEQRRIAAILDQADALRAKRRVALAQLDSLTQSIFIEMFGDVLSNPKAWPVKRLDEVCNFFAGNSLPDGVPFVGQEGGYFLMKVSDMNLEGNEKSINVCQSWSPVGGARSSTCPVGSIVIPKRGGAIGTNKKRVTTRETVLDPNVMAISPNLSFLLREYLFHWFQCFDLSSISSGSSVPQLNKQDLAPLTIQAPPISLQQDFAKLIQAIETLKANHNDALQELDRLFASLQHRAFQGEL